jgi:hypothetical protein
MFEPKKKHLFFDIFSTNIDTLVSSLYPQHRSLFDFCSQPLPHLRFNLFLISETFATFLDPVVNRFMRQTLPTINRKHFFMNIL